MITHNFRWLIFVFCLALVSACGGGGGDSNSTGGSTGGGGSGGGSGGGGGTTPPPPPLSLKMFSATSATGPWTSQSISVAGTGAQELLDPAPLLMSDGRILLYYLMVPAAQAGAPQAGWQIGVAESTDNGLTFTHKAVAATFTTQSTDPSPMVLSDGRIRLLVNQPTGSGHNVVSVTSTDASGLTFPATLDTGMRATGNGIPGALRIGNTYYLYTCPNGIGYATSSDGLTFTSAGTAIAPIAGNLVCDPSPLDMGNGSYLMAFKRRPSSATAATADIVHIASSSNGTTWTEIGQVGSGSVPGLVRDRNGVLRIYAPAIFLTTPAPSAPTNPLPFNMYTATSSAGPWTKTTATVGGSDALSLVDPSPIRMPDGSILLYYLMSYVANADPAASQPNNQWKMGVAQSLDNGVNFAHKGVAYTFGSSTTDPFPMLLPNGRIRLLFSQGSTVLSITANDNTGLSFPATLDSGSRSTTGGIPGALLIGAQNFLYTCNNGINYATSSDGLNFTTRGLALARPTGSDVICDPSPIDAGGGNYLMAYKIHPTGGASGPAGDRTWLASSTNGTSWTSIGQIATGGVPGLVRDSNGILRVYIPNGQ